MNIADNIKGCITWCDGKIHILYHALITARTRNGKDCTLTAETKKQLDDFWGHYRQMIPWYIRKYMYRHCAFYINKTGLFSEIYIPDNLYYTLIDTFYNNHKFADYLDNKCLYDVLLAGVKQPVSVAKRMNQIWYVDNIPTTEEHVKKILSSRSEFVLKIATYSSGGHGVYFLHGDETDKLASIISNVKNDIIIQEPLRQHSALSVLNPSSVNTIRLISLLRNNEVKVYSCIIRMGIDGSRVDNASSGGITCGINKDGRLNEFAFSAKGKKYLVHPSTSRHFNDTVVPSFKKCQEIVKKVHLTLPWFRLISWDFAIDECGDPVLIETNLRYGELDFHQLNNGPLFGVDTADILNEVLSKTK